MLVRLKITRLDLTASKGRYIHQLHGDDLVYDGFYKEMEALFNESPSAGAAFSRTNYIDYGRPYNGRHRHDSR